MKLKSATITGESTASFIANKLPIARLIDWGRDKGIRHFYSGMSLGVEQIAAEILSDRCYKWTAVVPSFEPNESWDFRQKQKYRKLLKRTNKPIILFEQYSEKGRELCYQYMIHRSDFLLTYWNETSNEIENIIELAKGKNLHILIFNPFTKKFQEIPKSWTQLNLLDMTSVGETRSR
jgi:uncharacterized phage-like protein YoqJ